MHYFSTYLACIYAIHTNILLNKRKKWFVSDFARHHVWWLQIQIETYKTLTGY